MKKIKIIPFIISVLFPLVITAFVVCYSYGVNDVYTTNKLNYENEVYYKYYDEDNSAEGEIEKNIKFISNKYKEINPVLTNSKYQNDFKTKFYAYTYYTDTIDEDGETVKVEYFNISLFIYDVNYRTYKKIDEYNQDKVVMDETSSIAVIYVKGIGEPAEDRISDAIEELKVNALESATLLDSYETSFIDHNQTGSSDERYAMKASFINSTKGEDVLTYDDYLDEYSESDKKYLSEGYTFAIVNYTTVNSETKQVKEIARYTTTDVQTVENFDASEGLSDGYKENFDLAGLSYISYIWPTLLWQGLLTLFLTGILGVLFYAIWSNDTTETEEQKQIKKLQKDMKKNK